ncbi:MAG: hypothetical protein J6S67_05775 [Methanobrevibacter sp.]|nr:hypothetical protein [Methanobrevibacter sp.]
MRIEELRSYLFEVLNSLTQNVNQINANMLSNKIDNYSLDKIPTDTEVEQWITGDAVRRDVYSFRSRKAYSQDTINNLRNIGFFEEFENKIKSNNKEGILPNIDGIESIECLNCGTMYSADGVTAEFDIQIQITYREGENASL